MKRKCTSCNIEMKKALLSANGGCILLEKDIKKFLNNKFCGVDTYVCPRCGYIELSAEKPEMFND